MHIDHEVLSALIDGDAIDPDELALALEDPGARRALVDFVRVRQATRGDDVVPTSDFYVRWQRAALDPPLLRRRVPLSFAAAAAVLAALVGSLVGPALITRDEVANTAPPVTRELRFEPGVDWGEK